MNLIEAWKQAKPGQVLKRTTCHTAITAEKTLHNKINNYLLEPDILADDWEIVKEKKKVVIEGITLKLIDGAQDQVLFGNVCYTKFGSVNHHAPLKMTLEWEE